MHKIKKDKDLKKSSSHLKVLSLFFFLFKFYAGTPDFEYKRVKVFLNIKIGTGSE